MSSQSGSIAPLSPEERFQTLQSQLDQAFKQGRLSDDDPALKELFSDFFKGNSIALSIIAGHDGKISSIISKLDQLGVNEGKIFELCSKILEVQKGKGEMTVAPKPPSVEMPVNLEFICDLDAQDHNGAMLTRFNSAIACENPLITTRTLFRASNLRDPDFSLALYDRDKALDVIQKRYDIFTNGPFLIFVPKRLGEELTEKERVEKLDLKFDAVKKIPLEEAWRQTGDKPSIEGFQKLFSDAPKHDKMIYIGGHGGVGKPAGLTSEHYRMFLDWVKTQRCQGLLVTSCYAGGKSAMIHLPEKKEVPEIPHMQPESPKGLSFPVFLRSIGDFPTISGQEAEKDVRSLFSRLTDLLNSPGGRTIFRLRKMLQEEEKGKERKAMQNLLQVYFPHSGDTPGGFRPVGEGGDSSSLTYVRYRKQQIEKGKIEVDGKEYLELTPAIIDCPIVFKGKNPVILSQIPGKACHLLNEVNLHEISPQDFLKKHTSFYKDKQVGVSKTLFISKLKSAEKELRQVFFDVKSGECGYREGDHYYLWNAGTNAPPVQITPLQYFLRWRNAVNESLPDPQALRVSTGAEQDSKMLVDALNKNDFWEGQIEVHDTFRNLLPEDRLKKLSLETFQELIAPLKLTDAEKISLIVYLLPINEALAAEFFEHSALSPDCKDEKGNPLIIRASFDNCIEFAKILIRKGADINASHPKDKNTGITLALAHEDGAMFKLLMQQDTVNLRAKNEEGNPVYSPAMLNLLHLKACLEKDPGLDLNAKFTTSHGTVLNLLGAAVHFFPKEVLEFLLQSGADPNGKEGARLPLTEAIINGNKEKIEMLLNYGASPFQKDSAGRYPIVEAMRRSPSDIVQKFLSVKMPEMEEKEKQELILRIFLSALESGEVRKIRLCQEMNPSFPQRLEYAHSNSLEKGLNRLHLFGRDDLIQELSAKIGTNNPEVSAVFSNWCLESAPELLLSIMDRSWNLPELIHKVIQRRELPQELKKQLISKAIELGADLNQSPTEFYSTNHINTALEENNVDLARFLIEKGAPPKPAALSLIRTGNRELINFAIEKGLQVESDDPSQPSLLRLAADSFLPKKEMTDLFKWLVEVKGADVNAFHNEESPFYRVVALGNKELYDFCLEHGAAKILDKDGVYSLLICKACGNRLEEGEEIIKDLVRRGGNLNAKGPSEFATLFSTIAAISSLGLVSWCLDHGALVNPENPESKLLPLQSSGSRKDPAAGEVFKLLVSKGGNLNQKGFNGSYPIIPVIAKGDLELVKFCFDQGATLEEEEVVQRAFVRALGSADLRVVQELETRGYRFSLAAYEEDKAAELLVNAYMTGGFPMFEKCVSLNPPQGAFAKASERMLLKIINGNDLKAMRLLESNGIVFNADEIIHKFEGYALFSKDLKGNDVLLEIMGRLESKELAAFLNAHLELLLYLDNPALLKYAFEHGADPNLVISDLSSNKQLIFKAIDLGSLEVVKCILDAGPDLTVKFENQDLLAYVKAGGKPEIARLIEEKMHQLKT